MYERERKGDKEKGTFWILGRKSGKKETVLQKLSKCSARENGDK